MSRAVRLNYTQRVVAPGRPLQTNELHKRLKKTHLELSQLEQETCDTQSLSVLRKDLLSHSLLAHKDKGVRIYTACCLADILRLFAPDAPYTENELREIFEFFEKQLYHLSDPEDPYFSSYYFLLESLATVRSIILAADLGDELLTSYFKLCFDIVRNDTQKNVHSSMLEILQALVEEAAALPNECTEILMDQFQLDSHGAPKESRQLAIDLCNSTADFLQKYVSQYFGEIILAGNGSSEEEADTEQRSLEEAHNMIIEINRIAPSILLNVIPQLEEELRVEAIETRTLATHTLGKMFSEETSKLAAKYPQVFKSWLDRRKDKIFSIRVAVLEYFAPLLRRHQEVSLVVSKSLMSKFADPDERVRQAAIRVVGLLDAESATNAPIDLIKSAGSRCLDKKPSTRAAAIKALGHLYKLMYPQMASKGDETDAREKYGWIPGHLMEILYLDEPDIKWAVEKVFHEDILEPNPHDDERTDRLLFVISSFTERQNKAFLSILSRQAQSAINMGLFLDQCDKYNGGVMDSDQDGTKKTLFAIVDFLAQKMMDPKKNAAHLQAFADANDRTVYGWMRAVMDPQTEYKAVMKHCREISKRLPAGSLETFAPILRRIALWLIGKNIIPRLIERSSTGKLSQDQDDIKMGQAAEALLKTIVDIFPAVYKNHIDKVTQLLQSDNEDLASDAVVALAKFVRAFPKEASQENDSIKKMIRYALEGSLLQAKNATVVLAQTEQRKQYISEILETIVASLSFENPNLVGHLGVLTKIARHASDLLEPYQVNLVNFVFKDIIMKSNIKTSPDDADNWIEFSEISKEGQAKVLSVKFLVNRLLSPQKSKFQTELAPQVLKLLKKILDLNGELHPNEPTALIVQGHLRLVAAKSLLKLSRHSGYLKMMSYQYEESIGMTIQDPYYQVRKNFIEKLGKYASYQLVPLQYLVFFMLAAHDPEVELRNKAKGIFSRKAKQQRSESNGVPVESTLTRFLYLISHLYDFSEINDDLQLTSKYIEFFLDSVASIDNVSYLFHLASQLKTVRDIHASSSQNLYIVSELAQRLILETCHSRNWTLPSYPPKDDVDSTLFQPLSPKEATDNLKKTYLPKTFLDLRQPVGVVGAPNPLRVAPPTTPRSKREGNGPARTPVRSSASKRPRKSQRSGAESGDEGDIDRQSDEEPVANNSQSTKTVRRYSRKSVPTTPQTPSRIMAPRVAKANAKPIQDLSSSEDEDVEADLIAYKSPSRPTGPSKPFSPRKRMDVVDTDESDSQDVTSSEPGGQEPSSSESAAATRRARSGRHIQTTLKFERVERLDRRELQENDLLDVNQVEPPAKRARRKASSQK
ncbi:armadillo-type protein [Polychytrium aggregatum]|uniref:armadillo-type protein n=1 Tax=Polychytrium aggregatum TaxID=110093 RepID=UPI0022FF1BF0|nr:armadillo-type protein [Polychytrium aggregatum]KAI9202801.1 armadillo-type protein [Polychytrium aggregatum]